MNDKQKPQTIKAYIDAAPNIAKPNLRALHACLAEVAPNAEQGIKWGSPTFTGKRIYFTFAGFKAHTNFYPTPAVVKAFADRLGDYRTTDVGISFPHDKPLPLELIREIAARRVRDVEENDAHWM